MTKSGTSDLSFIAIHLTFAWEPGLPIRPIDVRAQKIDGTMLDTLKNIVTAFLVTNKTNRIRFFKETFLVANVSLKVVFRMTFLILSNADVNFLGRKLQ